ncbi:hypothetical protein P168DRAFT_45775 [Aspergillus campestris IBT 28561]|uniref:Uncharacterized protein n=1 Tax=Aspergillus campestris (strain IBT 28561) TaxID=1392248 RepID=A0A2I1CXL0_ASPC2|nr:uncharacterized protein P168DRAFT_45775 [Aspergillus campestris IBT 28561]PKY02352.1 hypothetical protein P168DRAFT_45775 [Aspergillus campestris IBT 28561]
MLRFTKHQSIYIHMPSRLLFSQPARNRRVCRLGQLAQIFLNIGRHLPRNTKAECIAASFLSICVDDLLSLKEMKISRVLVYLHVLASMITLQ